MNYYKDKDGNVYAYDNVQVLHGQVLPDLVEMTPEEVEAHINPPMTPEQLQEQINAEARAYLLSTDWYVIRRGETGEEIPADVLAERSAARGRVVE